MRLSKSFQTRMGFTRVELFAVLTALALLAVVVWPAWAGTRPSAAMVECLNNLHKVGQGFQAWANDHEDRFPWAVSTAEGGAKESFQAFEHFLVVSNEFGRPRLLVCPSDVAKVVARDWNWMLSFNNNNLSYFAGLSATQQRPRTWLSGDRNVTVDVTNTSASAWGMDIHCLAGNLLLADGSVWQVSNRDVGNFVRRAAAQEPTGSVNLLKSPY